MSFIDKLFQAGVRYYEKHPQLDNLIKGSIRLYKEHKERQQLQRETERQNRENRKREILQSGPVIVSTNHVFHKAEYRQVHGNRGGQVRVQERCPNPDRKYLPHSQFTTSNRHPSGGNVSCKTVEDAVNRGYRPCYFCYKDSLELL